MMNLSHFYMEWVGIYKIMKTILFLISFLITSSAFGEARVYFINLEDGDTVESPFLIQFGLSEMGIACLLYTSPSPRDAHESRMPSSA